MSSKNQTEKVKSLLFRQQTNLMQQLRYLTVATICRQCGRAIRGARGSAEPLLQVCPCPFLYTRAVSKMVALCNVYAYSLCLAFSGVDIGFDFVLMTSAYWQYLKDSCKWCLALIGINTISGST